jgi:hypothetical protein
LNIIYLGGIYPTNIGNAFIDYGAIHSLKEAAPQSNIIRISGFSKTIMGLYGKTDLNVFDLLDKVRSDYIVLSGPFDHVFFPKKIYPIILRLKEKFGTKLIINSMGGSSYTTAEQTGLSTFLNDNQPYAIITRDRVTFDNYSHYADHSLNGIDSGFFVSDYFKPYELDMPDFVIHNFDRLKPSDFIKAPTNILKNVIGNKYKFLRSKNKIKAIGPDHDEKGRLIIRTYHASMPFIPNTFFNKSNVFISASPDDYLNLYANTKATYSNRVHACVATLAFNNPAALTFNTHRAALLERVGAITIQHDLTKINMNNLRRYKEKQIKFLRDIIK